MVREGRGAATLFRIWGELRKLELSVPNCNLGFVLLMSSEKMTSSLVPVVSYLPLSILGLSYPEYKSSEALVTLHNKQGATGKGRRKEGEWSNQRHEISA